MSADHEPRRVMRINPDVQADLGRLHEERGDPEIPREVVDALEGLLAVPDEPIIQPAEGMPPRVSDLPFLRKP